MWVTLIVGAASAVVVLRWCVAVQVVLDRHAQAIEGLSRAARTPAPGAKRGPVRFKLYPPDQPNKEEFNEWTLN